MRQRQPLVRAIAGAAIVLLATYNLGDYPATWFDEGSHLHVPQTLLRFGVYADYSSEGFRPYGPTLGVGPTIVLPIAASLALLGSGLVPARLVMACYLIAAIWMFARLARELGGAPLAWCATALLASSRGVALIEYGRQVLGEVPGLFFLLAGLALLLGAWERASVVRLAVVGLLFGAAAVTKTQYFLVIAPSLALAWLANQLHYNLVPARVFIVPAMVATACLAGWLSWVLFFLAPDTFAENWLTLRESAAGAALAFDPQLIRRSAGELLSAKVYLGALVPALVYGAVRALPRQRDAQRWGIVVIVVAVNLLWYLVASIGWLRYAFPALALASLLVARFFLDALAAARLSSVDGATSRALRWTLHVWLGLAILGPLLWTTWSIVRPPPNTAVAMAAYLDGNVPRQALIETWEPEMGFLTEHRYHFPPARLLNQAVRHIWLGGPPPWDSYRMNEEGVVDYVLVGKFGRGSHVYRPEELEARFGLVQRIGDYHLFALRKPAPGARDPAETRGAAEEHDE